MKKMMKALVLVIALCLVLTGCQYLPEIPGLNQNPEHVHTLIHNAEKAPTCVNNGILEHWYCPGCNARFSDEAATTEVTFADLEVEETGHKPGADDGDCTTAVDCTVCGKVATPAAKAHTPEEDDGDCTTNVMCTQCAKIAVPAKAEHEANEDDGDCTTAVTCKHCDHICVEAAEAHTPGDEATCTTNQICTVCEKVLVEGGHTAGAEATCTTAQICTVCEAVLVEATGHTWTDGVCACGAEHNVQLTASKMGLGAYKAGSVTVGGTEFGFTECGDYGNGIQMRIKNGNTASIWNKTAFDAGITKIVLVYNSAKSTYNNTDAFIFTFGNDADALNSTVKLSTVSGTKTYTVTPDAETYTYFNMKLNITYSFYWDSITIYLADGSVVTAE